MLAGTANLLEQSFTACKMMDFSSTILPSPYHLFKTNTAISLNCITLGTCWLYACRYQKKCDQLEVSNVEFRDKFEQLEENKKDIVAFIKKKLDEKGLCL